MPRFSIIEVERTVVVKEKHIRMDLTPDEAAMFCALVGASTTDDVARMLRKSTDDIASTTTRLYNDLLGALAVAGVAKPVVPVGLNWTYASERARS